jgi:hypothetical protein
MPYKDIEKRREYSRKYRAEHRDKNLVAVHKWQATHRETKRAVARRWRANNPEKAREIIRKSYLKFRDAHPERAKEKRRKHDINWRATHPEQISLNNSRRRAYKAETYTDLTSTQIKEIKRSGCLFCGTYDDLTIAHDTPISKKGNTTRGNCFCLCRSCNSAMTTKSLAQKLKQLNFSF